MTISKSHNNMLFMLASLACGQNESTEMMLHRIPASDTSDDETTASASPAKEKVVARRRRRPLKKRRPSNDRRLSLSSSLHFLGSSIQPRRSLLEASIDISNNSLPTHKVPAHEDSRDEQPALPESGNNDNDDDSVPQAVDEEMPSLVNDDAGWKRVHAPLELPNFLPCPAMALKDVKSIDLAIQER